MSANTKASQSILTNAVRHLLEKVVRREVSVDWSDLPIFQKIRNVQQSPGKVTFETGAFTVRITIDVQEKTPVSTVEGKVEEKKRSDRWPQDVIDLLKKDRGER